MQILVDWLPLRASNYFFGTIIEWQCVRGGGFRDDCLEGLISIEKWKENKDDWLSRSVFNFSLGKVSNGQKSRENTMNPHTEWLFRIIMF